MFNLHAALIAAGIPSTDLDRHESDLYVKSSPLADDLIESYQDDCLANGIPPEAVVQSFRDKAGDLWWDVSFAFSPFWDKCKTCDNRRQDATPTEDHLEKLHGWTNVDGWATVDDAVMYL